MSNSGIRVWEHTSYFFMKMWKILERKALSVLNSQVGTLIVIACLRHPAGYGFVNLKEDTIRNAHE